MRLCPSCNKIQPQLNMRGWVLKVTGSVLLDEEGGILNMAPLSPEVVVEQGKELDSPYIKVSCPSCGFTSSFNEFKPVVSCWITGSKQTSSVDLPILGEKQIDTSQVNVQRLTDILRSLDAATGLGDIDALIRSMLHV